MMEIIVVRYSVLLAVTEHGAKNQNRTIMLSLVKALYAFCPFKCKGQIKKKIMDKYLKWIATGFLMIGAACNSLNIYPIGPIATLVGGMCWLAVSIMWREAALITTNLVLSTITIVGLVYTYFH